MAKEWTNGFYTSKEWRKTRDAYYRIQCGMCERCMAEVLAGARRVEDINPGIIVHHKKELTPENINDPAVALSFDNLELLCDEHHNRQHKYKTHYDLGDIVTVKKKKWGIVLNQRITELQEVYEYGGMYVVPTMGDALPEKIDWSDK